MTKRFFIFALVLCFIAAFSPFAFAVGSGGFENASFSAKQLALSGAGTATPDEPAAISYNPAGITDLPGVQVQSNANFLSLFTFKHSDTTGSTRSSGTINFIPTAYLTINPGELLGNRVAFGIGTDSPFGLMNKYDSTNGIVHYTGWRNWIKMYTIKPVMAVKVTDWLSIGGGPMWYRVYDFGGIQGYPNNLITAPFGITTPDGQIRLELSGQQWGWHLGTLLKIKEKHRLGFYFRSPVVVPVRGRAKVENANIPAVLGGVGPHNFETGVHSKLSLPMNMTWAYAFQPTEKTHYEVDFGYTHWATHKRLYFPADPTGNAADDAILNAIGQADKDWNDSFSLQLGASHKFTKKLTGRCGTLFYWTPVPKVSFGPAVPDSNRLSFSIGAGYKLTKHLTADLSYYTMFYFRRRINNSVGENAALLNSSVDGRYNSFLQGFTISLTLKWDDLFSKKCSKEEPAKDTAPSIDINSPA